MIFVDKNGKAVNNSEFTFFKRLKHTVDYILVKNGEGALQLFNHREKIFVDMPYENISAIEGLNGYFTGTRINAKNHHEKLVINNKGEVIYEYEYGKGDIIDGLLLRFVEPNFELFDVMRKKIVLTIPSEKYGSIRAIRKVGNEFYIRTYDNEVFSYSGIGIENAPWNFKPVSERDNLLTELKSQYPNHNSIKLSGAIFNKYYIVTMGDLQGIISLNGTVVVDFDRVKIVALDSDRFLWKGINIYKGNVEIQLNENLELTRIPHRQILRRVQLEHAKVKNKSMNFKYWKWVNIDQLRNGYLVFQDEEFVHVFMTSGEYVSSYEGVYRNTLSNFSFSNYDKDEPFFSRYIELTRKIKDSEEYVRLYVDIENGKEFMSAY